MTEDPTTRELRIREREREQAEFEQAQTAADEQEAAAHARRAEKARYLREKLDERAEAERERPAD